MVLPALIAGGASVLGGIMQRGATRDANKLSHEQFMAQMGQNSNQFNRSMNMSNKQFRRQMKFARKQQATAEGQWNKALRYDKKQAQLDRQQQRNFAKNAAGWQMEDLFETADASGIHRLAALGAAGGAQYTPVGAGAPSPTGVTGPSPTGSPSPMQPGSPQVFEEERAFIGDAIGNALQAQQDAYIQGQRATYDAKQMELMDAQIASINAQTRTTIDQNRRAATNITTKDQSQAMADPRATRPEAMRIQKGPYKGQYVVTLGGKNYIASTQNTPSEGIEAIFGDAAKELASWHNITDSMSPAVIKNGTWVKQGDANDYRRPKSKPPKVSYKGKNKHRQEWRHGG